jgi:hypothetical protein
LEIHWCIWLSISGGVNLRLFADLVDQRLVRCHDWARKARQVRAREDAQNTSAVALEPEHAFALGCPQELDDARKTQLALVEALIDSAQVLLQLTHVQGPARRQARAFKELACMLDALLRLRGIQDRGGLTRLGGRGTRR